MDTSFGCVIVIVKPKHTGDSVMWDIKLKTAPCGAARGRRCSGVSVCGTWHAPARAGTAQLSALLQNAGGKTTPWMVLITVDLPALPARQSGKPSELPEFSVDPTLWNRLWTEFPREWQAMVNSACATATAEFTVQRCTMSELTLASEPALRTHMYRVHGTRGVARLFIAGNRCPVCEKCFYTPARAVQHTDNTKCKHAMMRGECVENAPEKQARLDREIANFRRNAGRGGLSFLACTKADGTA